MCAECSSRGLLRPCAILCGLTGVIFLWSGLAKLWDPISFAGAVAGYRLTGPLGTLVVAAALPAIEVVCAIGLCAPRWRSAAVTVLLAACTVFLIALAQAWVRGLDIHCGCFGEHGGTSRYPYWIGRDLVLLGTLTWLRQTEVRAGIRFGARQGAQIPIWETMESILPGWAGRCLSKTMLLLGLGVALGVTVDAFHPRGALWSELKHRNACAVKNVALEQPTTLASGKHVETEVLEVDMDDLRSLLDVQGAILVDARARVFWRLGHAPGALSLPHDDFARSLAEVRPRLEAESHKQIVVYCYGGDCHDGESVAGRLIAQGIEHVRLFRGGWDAWEKAGLPKE